MSFGSYPGYRSLLISDLSCPRFYLCLKDHILSAHLKFPRWNYHACITAVNEST